MTRAEVEEILKLRYEATKEKWGEGTLDAWQDWLGDLKADAVRTRLRELVRGGTTHIPVGLLAQGLAPTPRASAIEGDCEHQGADANGRIEWNCPRCDARFIAGTHPRAEAAFLRGYREATGRDYREVHP